MTLEYELLAQLIDKNDCRYDHNGKCQEHSLHSFPCPHERAKLLLANPKDESALEAQRDALLAALEAIQKWDRYFGNVSVITKNQAEAAIAMAKGNQP